MGKFDGILICTDLDGTALKKDKTVSEENLRAIEYFKSEGGYFTFVTGRMPYYSHDAARMLVPNAPVGCVNGGGLYDFDSGKYIWTAPMPEGVQSLIRTIDEKFSDVGIQVSTFDKTYFAKESKVMEWFRTVTRVPYAQRDYNDITEPIGKVLFGSDDEEELLAIERTLRSHPMADGFEFVRSAKQLFEILPYGITKGVSILRLAEHLGLDIKRTVAVGDYNNDIPMFRTAGVGVAVANACPAAKEAADYITVSNEEHAIANVIYDLESGKISL